MRITKPALLISAFLLLLLFWSLSRLLTLPDDPAYISEFTSLTDDVVSVARSTSFFYSLVGFISFLLDCHGEWLYRIWIILSCLIVSSYFYLGIYQYKRISHKTPSLLACTALFVYFAPYMLIQHRTSLAIVAAYSALILLTTCSPFGSTAIWSRILSHSLLLFAITIHSSTIPFVVAIYGSRLFNALSPSLKLHRYLRLKLLFMAIMAFCLSALCARMFFSAYSPYLNIFSTYNPEIDDRFSVPSFLLILSCFLISIPLLDNLKTSSPLQVSWFHPSIFLLMFTILAGFSESVPLMQRCLIPFAMTIAPITVFSASVNPFLKPESIVKYLLTLSFLIIGISRLTLLIPSIAP